MKGRCFRISDPAYDRYGGRGITVCERWAAFENFLADISFIAGNGPIVARPVGMTDEKWAEIIRRETEARRMSGQSGGRL